MNIGVDVDGVLTDLESYQLRCGKRYFEEKRHIAIANAKAYDIKEIYGCSQKERGSFWKKYIWKYCLFEPMREGAAREMRRLRKQGHRIIIISSRAHTTEKGFVGALFRWMLKHWLKKNHFVYDEIHFCSETESASDKAKICLERKVDVLIDDKVENLLAVKDKINIICYSAAWNEHCWELDGCRVRRMDEVRERVLGMGS